MARRFAFVLVLSCAVMICASGAFAKVTQVKTTLSIDFAAFESGGSFAGAVDARANHFCLENRLIELFRNGVKVSSVKTDNYGNWKVNLTSVQPGNYMAKTKKKKLPAALQAKPGKKNAIFCKAANSKVLAAP